ncbi:hypothetical protein [Microvirga pakistanensis]|nr:hypothetical protein [Microvirga pakistanensis]
MVGSLSGTRAKALILQIRQQDRPRTTSRTETVARMNLVLFLD